MAIHILDDRVIDQIAAGEVVERPASVVKELVENALDAGATRLMIRLKAGGVAAVEVVDDGAGMSRADAALCIERHATSKIRAAEDLVGVVTMGFRGEALAAIAAVSRLVVRTRRTGDEVGTEVVVEHGRLEAVRDAACPAGTEISVRSLFGAAPARRKFLRSAQTELEHALEAVRRAVMWRPDVAVGVSHEGRAVLRSEAGDLGRRMRDVLGQDAEVILPIRGIFGQVRVEGLMAPPSVHRPAASGSVYLYVNGRFVRDAVVRRAVADGLRGALPAGRHPLIVLGIEVPGEDVDVNVHPQKVEVRFQNPLGVANALTESLRQALRGGARRVGVSTVQEEAPRVSQDALFPEVVPRSRVSAMPPEMPPTPAPAPRGAEERAPIALSAAEVVAAPPPASEGEPPAVEQDAAPAPAAVPEEGPWIAAEGSRRFRDLRVLGVHGGRFAVASEGADLVVIDLDGVRRADLTADLAMRAARGELRSAPLRVPARVDLARPVMTAVIGAADSLSSFGVDLHALGPGSVAVIGLPEGLGIHAAPLLEAVSAAGGDVAAALARVARLEEPTLAEARGLLARIDELPSLAEGRVMRVDQATLLRGTGGRA